MAGGKVENYPNETTTLVNSDLFDLTKDVNGDGSVWDSQKMTWATLKAQLLPASGIYGGDGTVPSGRVATLSGNLGFLGADPRVRIGQTDTPATATLNIRGASNAETDLSFFIESDNGTDILRVANNGFVGVGLSDRVDQQFDTDIFSVNGSVGVTGGLVIGNSTPTDNYVGRFFRAGSGSNQTSRLHFGRFSSANQAISLNTSIDNDASTMSWASSGASTILRAFMGVKAETTGYINGLEQYGFGIRTREQDFIVNTFDGANNTREASLFIQKQNGNVGIGDETPVGKLTVRGANNTQATYAYLVENSDETSLLQVRNDGSVVVGSPTGGAKGIGTINAQGVYDDNVQLSDYVFDHVYDEIKAEDIEKQPRLKDYKIHTIEEARQFVEQNKHLPTIIGRLEYEKQGSSIGMLVSQLWETLEIQFLYIADLQKQINLLAK